MTPTISTPSAVPSGKARSLMHRNIWTLVICIAVLFLLAAPLFYLLTRNFYAEDLLEAVEYLRKGHDLPPSDLNEDIIAGLMIQFFLFFIILSVSLLVMLRVSSRRLWKPFYDTLNMMEDFDVSQAGNQQPQVTRTEEFNRLNESVIRLMNRDAARYQMQKAFTANASHELQTPLAVMRGHLDLLMQDHLTESQMTRVNALYEETSRLSHLSKSLLLLAHIDSGRYTETQTVDMKQLLARIRRFALDVQPEREIEIISSSDNPLLWQASPELAETLVRNLLMNALNHSPRNSRITIETGLHAFSVINDATGQALPQDKVFLRFGLTDPHNGGHGLGLSIIKAICDEYHWKVTYRFQEGRHCFCVTG